MRPADPNKGVWPTPDWLFAPLHARHRFDLDAAASKSNAKCRRFFSEQQNALTRAWKARCFWNNPPYGCEPGTGTLLAAWPTALAYMPEALPPAPPGPRSMVRFMYGPEPEAEPLPKLPARFWPMVSP